MKLIFGLGSPGSQFEWTRHNIGFHIVDSIAAKYGTTIQKSKYKGLVGDLHIDGTPVKLIKPMTFINNSGESVIEAVNYLDVKLENILIIIDEIYLPLETLRMKMQGSSSGHNGMKSIIKHLNTEAFDRMRVGVGEQEVGSLRDHVLAKFTKDEMPSVNNAIERAHNATIDWITRGPIYTMSKYN